MNDLDPLRTLHRCPLFADFAPSSLEALLPYFDIIEGQRGDRLYEQGAPSDGFYIVAAGSLVMKVTDIDGKERSVTRVAPPESFGELAVLLRGDRFVTVEAATTVTLLEFSYDAFRRLKRANPDLCLLLIMAIVRRFGRMLDESRDVLHRLLLRQFAGMDES